MTTRLVWRRLHLFIGVASGAFLLLMALSGIVLLFAQNVDRWLYPSRYAVSGQTASQSLDVDLANAEEAVPNGEPAQVRWPAQAGLPLRVMMRMHDDAANAASNKGGGRMNQRTVYIDPPTGRVLGTADPRASFVGLIHSLHSDLLVPAFGGRQIVGINGVCVFFLCLSGIFLWWPRNAGFLRGLQWRRGPTLSRNLHHRVGFWIAVPLAIMAFTGVFQAFQQPGKALIGLVMPMSEPMRHDRHAAASSKPSLAAQMVVDLALKDQASLRPTRLFFPGDGDKSWHLEMADANGNSQLVLIDDEIKTVSLAARPPRGDLFIAFMRRIHEGAHDGPLWQTVVLLSGASPPVLFVTGLTMWFRRRRDAKVLSAMKRQTETNIEVTAIDKDHIAA